MRLTQLYLAVASLIDATWNCKMLELTQPYYYMVISEQLVWKHWKLYFQKTYSWLHFSNIAKKQDFQTKSFSLQFVFLS